ncbi:CRTAC1 family protein [Candidatus Halobonum tyrrellensis]|uniref:ASPIC/UnbV domain-containing protein n=1 Tax=Candidatus Halobonum tyrrellensis G22 TaxID=1324957 RepID=V4IV93_9EURY|nr:CRTAC1 family protein [Candidatus Halobonum tyrrellensis]ESP87122.1 ASPIC/UnbV domain-containing protein [Candidatus Halobonum tyrrellensis G22]
MSRRDGRFPVRVRAVVLAFLLVASAGCLGVGGDLGGLSADDGTDIDFRDRTDAVGLDYRTDGGGAGNGDDGVYVADYDRDGWRDVLAVGGDRPALFRNAGGEFERVDGFPEFGEAVKSALFVDYDGDGWDDLLLLRSGAEPVLLDNEAGTFERSDASFGNLTYPLGATAADYDRDGDLDLLIYQSGDWKTGKPEGYFGLTHFVAEDNGNPNVLYENTDDGFERVTDAGVSGADRWSLAASFVDLNGDRLPDVHVANDYNTDVVYINEGNGSFEERLIRGNTSRNGMSSEVADVNGDGAQDVFTTNIYLPLDEVEDDERHERLRLLFGYVLKSGRTKGNTLMLNDGEGTLTDRAVTYRVRQGGWGWAASLADLDNDGDRDLIHATQNVVRIDQDDPHYTHPMLFERDGETFENLDASARNLSEHDGRGLVTFDYDRDGDRDVVIAPYDGNVTVYENVGATANSVAFRVVDANGSTVYGAEVTVAGPGGPTEIQQTVESDFLSQESRVFHLGLGDRERTDLTVVWPDGTERTFEDVAANQQLRITENGTETVVDYGG